MLKLGWFSVRDIGLPALVTELRSKAASLPREAVPDEFLVTESGRWASANLGGWELAYVHDWAQAVSKTRLAVVLSFRATEGLWEWRLFASGENVAGMEPRAAGRVFLFGDLRAAGSLLSVDAELFKSYCRTYYVPEPVQGLIAQLLGRDLGSSLRAFPGDTHSPYEEWAQVDFARRLGIEYPDRGAAKELSVQTEKRQATPRQWPSLPPRLVPLRSRVWPRSTWIERFHPRNWGG